MPSKKSPSPDQSKIQIMDTLSIKKALLRIAHEIIEKNKGILNLVIIGIKTRGEYLAKRIAHNIKTIENKEIKVGSLDITLYRDDISSLKRQPVVQKTDISFNINNKNIILIDDVLFAGRTIRSALDELMDFGRPKIIQLAVLIDRGHRELPIKADYIGKTIPTSKKEVVKVFLKECDGEDKVIIFK